MINNPAPVIASTFSGMWVTNLQVIFPTSAKKGILQANLLPYDGTHLLAAGGKRAFVNDIVAARSTDSVLDGVLTSLVAEVQRQSSKTSAPQIIQVNAQDPTGKVSAQVIFEGHSVYRIADCYALCATDEIFAGVFLSMMGEVARLAGLTIS